MARFLFVSKDGAISRTAVLQQQPPRDDNGILYTLGKMRWNTLLRDVALVVTGLDANGFGT
jgi:hypothetical protein